MGAVRNAGNPRGLDMTALPPLLRKTVAYWIIWLFVVGQATAYVFLLGLVCSLVVAWIDLRRSPPPARPFPWFRFLLYLPWLAIEVVKSGLHVTRLILHPRMPISPRLIPCKIALRDPAGLVLLGNSITLTPGTITVEISQDALLVHAIDSSSAESVLNGTMERRVAHVFEPPPGATA
ncbi:Na+/H+ antiporter subunit E [Petrachloros mirabilis]